LPVASIDRASRKLTTVGPIGCQADHYAIDHFEEHPRYWLEGHPAFANRSGEWFIDQRAMELVLRAGDEPKPPTVELPILETLLIAAGEGEDMITGLVLEGLVFTGSRFPMSAGGLAGAQASMHEPRSQTGERITSGRPMLSACVQIDQAERCTIQDCHFESLGNTALWIGSRARGCRVADSVFDRVGGNAINVGENNDRRVNGQTWHQALADQVPTGNTIIGCDLSRCGQVLPGSVAIWAAINRGLTIQENSITDCPYTGISLGWVWDPSETPAGDNHIHHNRISDIMQVLSDGGGVYTLGRQPGSRIEFNTIENVPVNAGRAESNGIFLDQGSTGFEIAHNRFRRIAKSPLRFHQAGENSAHDNAWELETEQTPPVRYNRTPRENVHLSNNTTLDREVRVFLIGNSLTWDTSPQLLDGFVRWHVDCGKSLPFLFENPEAPCVKSSHLWPLSLPQLRYDYLSLQTHYGSTLEEDFEVISKWMQIQPSATIVIHAGWAREADAAQEYRRTDGEAMFHGPAYWDRLLGKLKASFPDREIRLTGSTDALHRISNEIQSGVAPLEKIGLLYRDAIHMTQDEGRYLMHNVMRAALDQPPSANGFPIENQNPNLKAYLDRLFTEDD
jgi:hypothetical protein